MADNVDFTPGTGATGATDDIGGIHYPRVKLSLGADGSAVDAVAGSGVVGTGVQRVVLATDVALPAGTNNIGDVDVLSVPAAVQTALDNIETAVEAVQAQTLDVAHDAADSGNPVKIGGYASAAAPTGVSGDADRVNAWFLRNGAQATVVTAAGALIGGDATNGLDVDVTRMSALVAGEAHVGEIGGKSIVHSVTLSTDTSAYASGDLIADTQQMDAFFRKADGTGIIQSITIIDEDAQGAALYILFMTTSTSLGTENSAPNITDANLTAGLCGIVTVATTDYITLSGAKVACIRNIGIPVKAVSGTDDLYIAVLNATGTPTYTASGLEMRIGALLD